MPDNVTTRSVSLDPPPRLRPGNPLARHGRVRRRARRRRARAARDRRRRSCRSCATSARKLKLIASENFASPAVLLAMGNWLSDKYAEGSPGHRFYAGCDNVDAIESRAAELARTLFGADHAYVQPHSGIDANLVAFWTVLDGARRESRRSSGSARRRSASSRPTDWETLRRELGDQKMMGMALDSGGHLTHGFRPNVSGQAVPLLQLRRRPRDVPARLRRGAASARARSGRC